jgi:uncharacterized RDD family membrane protein YckC
MTLGLVVKHSYDSKIASIGQRVAAGIIDLFIYLILSFLIALIFVEKKRNFEDNGSGFSIGILLPNYIVFLWMFLWLIFITTSEYQSGQTIGKRILKIKVVRQNLTKATFANIFLRHLFDIIDIILFAGLVVAFNNKKRQRIGDLIAKTIVIRSN